MVRNIDLMKKGLRLTYSWVFVFSIPKVRNIDLMKKGLPARLREEGRGRREKRSGKSHKGF
jgi:hypothetical protein